MDKNSFGYIIPFISLGHAPGAAATCTTPQVCTVCGEILTPATGHIKGDWEIEDSEHHGDGCVQVCHCVICGATLDIKEI